jgi:NitT/TauT family transport system ATP-binding protein
MVIKNLCKSYGDNKVYDNFNLEIEEGKITCILGESGSGKTTLLNIIARLTPFEGEVENVTASYIFQTPRLVPNLTVLQNLKLIEKDEGKIESILKAVGLDDKKDSYTKTLSGGQAQRAAISRAFLYKSDIILMDEPFSSLDLKLKIKIMDLFLSLQKGDKRTALFVTHDVDEAVYLADRIIILRGGKIICDEKNVKESGSYGQNSAIRQKLLERILN